MVFLRFLMLLIVATHVSAQQAADSINAPESETATIETPSIGEIIDNTQAPEVSVSPNANEVSSSGQIGEVGLVEGFFRGIKTLLVLGGPVVWILLLVSILGLTLAFTKFLQFSRTNPLAMKVLDDAISMWFEGNTAKASGNLERSAVPIAKDIQFGLEMRGTLDAESLQDEMIRRSSGFLREYSNNLKPLELIYYLAPVMGLLGTVLGMIDAFRGLAVSAGAAGESSALAGGIWEALLTTAVGLSIAIPFAVMHAVLETKLDNLTDQIGDMITRVCSKNEVT